MLTVERMTEGGFSGASRCVRCAEGISGEYIVRWRSVRSLILSRLLASTKSQKRKQSRGNRRTEEAKVTGMDYCLCVCLACKVVESRKTASYVCYAEYSAMGRVENMGLGVDLTDCRERRDGGF